MLTGFKPLRSSRSARWTVRCRKASVSNSKDEPPAKDFTTHSTPAHCLPYLSLQIRTLSPTFKLQPLRLQPLLQGVGAAAVVSSQASFAAFASCFFFCIFFSKVLPKNLPAFFGYFSFTLGLTCSWFPCTARKII